MEHIFTIAALWLGLAVISAVIAYHLRISIALIEICVGVVIASAVIPTLIAGLAFLPRHLLTEPEHRVELMPVEDDSSEEG